jgi:membrane protease YdiL (CAAX protease family)
VTARVAFLGRATAAGRAVLWVAVFALVGGGASWALFRLGPAPSPGWWLAWGSLSSAAGFAFATWFVGRVLDRRSWAELGWRPSSGVARALGAGTALGAVMAAGAVGLAVLAGGARFTTTGEWASWGTAALPLGVGLLLAALTEELMFRGYSLSRLADALGPGPATALGAVGFGLAHLGNPSATAFSTLNVALAGVWLACAFFSPGAMPLAWGAHFGWNATLALGFRAPVSGYAFPVPAVAYRAGARGWIDGGAFGPEGGIVATLVMVAGTAAIVLWSRRARTAEPLA